MSVVEEIDHLRQQSASSPETTIVCLDRVVELLQYNIDGALVEELSIREAAAETLRNLAAHDGESVAEYTELMLSVLREETQREFADVESVATDLKEDSTHVIALVVEGFRHTFTHNPEPLENKATVDLLIDLDRQNIAREPVRYVLAQISVDKPQFLVPHVSYLRTGLKTEHRLIQVYTMHLLLQLTQLESGEEHVRPLRDWFVDIVTSGDSEGQPFDSGTRKMANRLLFEIIEEEPSSIISEVPDLLSVGPELTEENFRIVCDITYMIAKEQPEAVQEWIPTITEVIQDAPIHGQKRLIDVVDLLADTEPTMVVPLAEMADMFLNSDDNELATKITKLLIAVCEQEQIDLIQPHTDQIINNLTTEDESLQRASARLILTVQQRDRSLFEPYSETIQTVMKQSEGLRRAMLAEELGQRMLFSKSSPLYQPQNSRSQTADFQSFVDEFEDLSNLFEQNLERIFDQLPIKEIPPNDRVISLCRSNTDRERLKGGVMFSYLCIHNPDRAKYILNEIPALPESAPEEVKDQITNGATLLSGEDPEIADQVIDYLDTYIYEDDPEQLIKIAYRFEFVAQNRREKVVELLLDEAGRFEQLLDHSDHRVRFSYARLIGIQIEEYPEVGRRFLETFVEMCDDESPATVGIIAQNLYDVVKYDPELIEPYLHRIFNILDVKDREAQQFAVRILSYISRESNIDVTEVIDSRKDAIFDLLSDNNPEVRKNTVSLLSHYAKYNVSEADEVIDALIKRLYDGESYVQIQAAQAIEDFVYTREIEPVLSQVDYLVDLLNSESYVLTLHVLHTLVPVAAVDPTPFATEDAENAIISSLTDPIEPEFVNRNGEIKRLAVVLLFVLQQQGTEEWYHTYNVEGVLNEHAPEIDPEEVNNKLEEVISDVESIECSVNELISPDETNSSKHVPDTDSTEAISLPELDKPEIAVRTALDELANTEGAQCKEPLRRLVAATDYNSKLVAEATDELARCLDERLPEVRDLAVIALSKIEDPDIDKILKRTDIIGNVLRRTDNEEVLEASVSLLALCTIEDVTLAAPYVDKVADAAREATTTRTRTSALVILGKLAEHKQPAVEDYDFAMTVGMESTEVAGAASVAFRGYVEEFEKAAPESIHAAATVIQQPHQYEQETVMRTLRAFTILSKNRTDAVADYTDEISRLLGDRIETTDGIVYYALTIINNLAASKPRAVVPFINRVEPALKSNDENHVEAAVSVMYALSIGGGENVETNLLPPLIKALQSSERTEVRGKAASVLESIVINENGRLDRDGANKVLPHSNELVELLPSVDAEVGEILLRVIGALAEWAPTRVTTNVELIISMLAADQEELRRTALIGVYNLTPHNLDTVVDHIPEIINILSCVEDKNQLIAGLKIINVLLDADPEYLVPHLERLLGLAGELSSEREPLVGQLCRDIMDEAGESLKQSDVDAALRSMSAATSGKYVEHICSGIRALAIEVPATVEPHHEDILQWSIELKDQDHKGCPALISALGEIAKTTPETIVPHLDWIGKRLEQAPSEERFVEVEVFCVAAQENPTAVANHVDVLATVLTEDSGKRIVKALFTLRMVAEHEPDSVVPLTNKIAELIDDSDPNLREAALKTITPLAKTNPETIESQSHRLRNHLTEGPGIATPTTRAFGHLVTAGVVAPTTADIEALLSWSDDPDLAYAKMNTIWVIASEVPDAVESYRSKLSTWTVHDSNEAAVIATDTLLNFGTKTKF